MSSDPSSVPSQPPGSDLRTLIESIAKALVDAPESVQVNEVAEDNTTVLEIRVAEGDVGKVIGRQGRTVRAMRTLVGAASVKLHRRITLEVVE